MGRTATAEFQSTLSMRRATNSYALYVVGTVISIHALHEESDNRANDNDYDSCIFQSTLSMRRATELSRSIRTVKLFQSTLSMRRATTGCADWAKEQEISIHALHEESDHARTTATAKNNISIHALHEESDWPYKDRYHPKCSFQSTLSMRRATCTLVPCLSRTYFNPRSP